jgi:hypothetical protein
MVSDVCQPNLISIVNTLGNVTYDVYINTSASTAELWIDQDLTVV